MRGGGGGGVGGRGGQCCCSFIFLEPRFHFLVKQRIKGPTGNRFPEELRHRLVVAELQSAAACQAVLFLTRAQTQEHVKLFVGWKEQQRIRGRKRRMGCCAHVSPMCFLHEGEGHMSWRKQWAGKEDEKLPRLFVCFLSATCVRVCVSVCGLESGHSGVVRHEVFFCIVCRVGGSIMRAAVSVCVCVCANVFSTPHPAYACMHACNAGPQEIWKEKRKKKWENKGKTAQHLPCFSAAATEGSDSGCSPHGSVTCPQSSQAVQKYTVTLHYCAHKPTHTHTQSWVRRGTRPCGCDST